jgi:Mrp family chromosome partitioning ATPase/capsular polysaccharide biosynthesis protein
MTSGTNLAHGATLRDYLQVVRRRKWIIAQAVLLVPAAALAFSLHQRPEYQGSAQVLLSQQDLSNQLTGTPSYNTAPADRQAQTQASLARVPAVAQGAIDATHARMSPSELLAASSVKPGTNSDLLTFTFTHRDPRLAQQIAAAYARSYVRYRLASDTAPIKTALHEVDAQLATLPGNGALRTTLEAKATQLRTIAALKTANASVVQASGPAVQTVPRTERNVILGFVLGLGLGIGLAFLREALDTRVRSADEISDRLGVPLLGRIPTPPKELRSANKIVMLAEPTGIQAEAFRMLRTNLEFAAVDRDVRTVLITSAVEQEGKTTTASNLAVTLARSGRQVALVDLDLRRPFVDKFFDLSGHPGLTEVVVGHASLDDALVAVPLTMPGPQANGSANGSHRAAGENGGGGLFVVGSGPIPPDPGEFVATHSLGELLGTLRERFEIVVIDAPPLLHVGDALALSPRVDALVLVTRLETVRRHMLSEVARLLEPLPTLKLGFVITGAQREDGYGYGPGYYGYSSSRDSQPAAPVGGASG